MRLALVSLVLLVAVGFWSNQNQLQSFEEKVATVTNGQCQSPGISVVIDFGSGSNQPILQKCVSDYFGNSWNLLEAAGLEITGTEKYPVGFVCRINQQPDSALEKCVETPGAKSGSWAYFLAEPNAKTWTYSSFGAATRKAKCGWAEGWRFLEPNQSLSTAPRVIPQTSNCEK